MFGSSRSEVNGAYRRFFEGRNIDLDDLPPRPNNFENEMPKHDVTIDLPIAIGLNVVTRQEWSACASDGACANNFDERIRFHKANGPYQDHPGSPITAITFFEMQTYVAWLNRKVGAEVYRLPTEAEWEYAARAGTDTIFAQGDTLTREQANFSLSRAELIDGHYQWSYDPTNERMPISVDRLYAANAWGIRHMSGNVSELTRSCWSERHLGFDSSSRYLAATFRLLGCERLTKGGAYLVDVELARPARRSRRGEGSWSSWVGFRVVRELQKASEAIK